MLPFGTDRTCDAVEEGDVKCDAGERGEHGDAVVHPERPSRLRLGAVVRVLVVHHGQHRDLLGGREEVVEEVNVQDGAEEHGVVVEE